MNFKEALNEAIHESMEAPESFFTVCATNERDHYAVVQSDFHPESYSDDIRVLYQNGHAIWKADGVFGLA